MKGWITLAALLLTVPQLSACGGAQPAACGMRGEPPHPEIGGVFLYTCSAPSAIKGDMFLLDVSSGHVRRLTFGAWNIEASWSPDGRRIAYESSRDGRLDIYVMDLETGAIRRLTDGRGFNGYPSWSPDSQWIAFESSRDGVTAPPDPAGYNPDLYVMRADGTGVHRVLSFRAVESAPAWSPAGGRIVFASDRSGVFDLYIVTPDGTDLSRVTDHGKAGGFAWVPRWSPDASRIVFYAEFSASDHSSIYWVRADGGEPHRVTNDTGSRWDAWPDWSWDGQWIAFTRAWSGHTSAGGHLQLFAVRPDGSDLTQLTVDGGDKSGSRWRPQ
jgi:Tol biopolymer transport system component